MKVLRVIFGMLTTAGAAFAGNWIGGQIRSRVTGETVQTIRFEHTTESGLHINSFPVSTKLYPALLFALVGQPRWLFSFLGGVLASLYIEDKYEALFLERVIAPLIENRIPREREQTQTHR
ncbi:MAG TPA: hypothetical protein DEH25_05625 [Chloroflexi bacterium]|nr:hypothetical protein [Chloroflexota bacterium]